MSKYRFSNGKNNPAYKHGYRKHKLYIVWQGMMRRCYDKKFISYEYYGARGIKVDKKWHDVKTFIEDCFKLKWKSGLTIDRINVDGHYAYENCRFVSMSEQNKNKRLRIKPNKNKILGLPIGVRYREKQKKQYVAQYRGKHIGSFSTIIEAKNAYENIRKTNEI